MARHAHLVGEQRDLDQVFDDDAEHDVVRDLADARQFAFADIGDALRREHFDQRHGRLGDGFRTGHNRRQLAGLDHLGRCRIPAQQTNSTAVLPSAARGSRRILRPRSTSSRRRSSASCPWRWSRCRSCRNRSLRDPCRSRRWRTPRRTPARSDRLVDDLAADLAASGSALDRVRFQIVTSWPALSRRSAIGEPMRPTPIQPIFCVFFDITKLSPLHFCRAPRRERADRNYGLRFSRSAAKSPEARRRDRSRLCL